MRVNRRRVLLATVIVFLCTVAVVQCDWLWTGLAPAKRAKGIEPSSKAWEAFVLPLNHARDFFSSSLVDGGEKVNHLPHTKAFCDRLCIAIREK